MPRLRHKARLIFEALSLSSKLKILIGFYMIATKESSELARTEANASLQSMLLAVAVALVARTQAQHSRPRLQVGVVYDVELPSELTSFLEWMDFAVTLGLNNLTSPLSCMGADGFEGTLLFWTIMPFCAVAMWTLVVALKARWFKTHASTGNTKRRTPTRHSRRFFTSESRLPATLCLWGSLIIVSSLRP